MLCFWWFVRLWVEGWRLRSGGLSGWRDGTLVVDLRCHVFGGRLSEVV